MRPQKPGNGIGLYTEPGNGIGYTQRSTFKTQFRFIIFYIACIMCGVCVVYVQCGICVV